MESFNKLGVWWQPENEEETLTGTLSFSPQNGLKLELVGSFLELTKAIETASTNKYKYKVWDRLVGFTHDGTYVTLIDCVETNPGVAFGRLRMQTFHCKMAYLGQQHLSLSECEFPEILVEYSYLLDWVARSGFQHEWIYNDNVFYSAFQVG